MADLTSNINAFSTFLKALNKTQLPGTTTTAPAGLPGPDSAILDPQEAFARFLRQVTPATAPAPKPASPSDPTAALLGLFANGPRSLAEVSASTGLPAGSVIEAIRPLEEYRLLRRVERDDELAFELTQGGRNLIQAGA